MSPLEKRIAIERGEITGWERRRGPRLPPGLKKGLAGIAAGALQLTPLYARGLRNAARPVVNEIDLTLPTLPREFDGFRILHLSDVHGDCVPGLAEAAAAKVAAIEADVCVLTGDYRRDGLSPCEEAYPALHTLLSAVRARHGAVGILGNCDSIEMTDFFEKAGVRLLVNDAWTLERGGAHLCWLGLDDPHDYGCDDLDGALGRAPADAFKILLVHTPELAAAAAAHGIDLYLCGHTHGGQVCLPLLGPLRRNTRCPSQFIRGAWRRGQMTGFTSRGIGVAGVPVRFGCPPEIAVIRLCAG